MRLTGFLLPTVLAAVLCSSAPAAHAQTRVAIVTSVGTIAIDLDTRHAPITTANFLRYVDAGLYDGGRFHRAVRLDNQVRRDVRIEVIQGGREPGRLASMPDFPAIALERTSTTGLRHVDGTLSMARGADADSASSDFFICIGEQPSLDAGGARAADGQGFAAFGTVASGMEVVRRIQAGGTTDREGLLEPIRIETIHRVPRPPAPVAAR